MQPKQSPSAKKPSHIKDFALLLAVPLGVTLLAAALVYIPRLASHPKYAFVYEYCGGYSCKNLYRIADGGGLDVVREPAQAYTTYDQDEQLGYYDPATGASHVLTQSEIRNLRLINSSKSPDGYTLVRQSGSSGFLFWNNYSDGWQLEKGLQKKPVQLYGGGDSYGNNLVFLGWVQK